MKSKNNQKIQPDWWSKTFAGLFLGLAFGIAMGSLVSLLTLGHLDRSLVPQFGMWTIPWVWMILFFLAYLFPKGWQAVVTYSIANLIAYTCIFWLRG